MPLQCAMRSEPGVTRGRSGGSGDSSWKSKPDSETAETWA